MILFFWLNACVVILHCVTNYYIAIFIGMETMKGVEDMEGKVRSLGGGRREKNKKKKRGRRRNYKDRDLLMNQNLCHYVFWLNVCV